MNKLILAMAIIFACHNAEALNGNEYIASSDSTRILLVTGLEEGFSMSHSLLNKASLWCEKEGVTFGQAKLILDKYLQENPAQLHNDLSLSYATAMTISFPCESDNGIVPSSEMNF
jgi:hypothetical protein